MNTSSRLLQLTVAAVVFPVALASSFISSPFKALFSAGPESATINCGTPQKDANVTIQVNYKKSDGRTGNFQATAAVNGTPSGSGDAEQETPASKAAKVAAAINQAAQGEDGKANTADDHPVSAGSFGAVVIITQTSGGKIRSVSVSDNGSGETDVEGLGKSDEAEAMLGLLELDGPVAGAAIAAGQSPSVSVQAGGESYTTHLQLGDTPHAVLERLEALLAADGISTILLRGNALLVRLPEDNGGFGAGCNDRTLKISHSVSAL